ncbi:hypothetical protein GCM10008965_16070 [Methylorubrum aminovorans]|nr:hypothetical protein GCM10025880_54850 [Methylorubrum aminovorans]
MAPRTFNEQRREMCPYRCAVVFKDGSTDAPYFTRTGAASRCPSCREVDMRSSFLRTFTILVGLAAAPALAQAPSPATPPTAGKPPAMAPAATPPATKEAKPDAKAELIDINSASAEELSQLKGIGEARSAAIVKGRPYRGKDELVRKKILPESVYAGIKDQIIAKQK